METIDNQEILYKLSTTAMLFKWFITISIIYFVYKYYIKPNALGQGEDQKRSQIRNSEPEADNEDEYIDYEEVE